MIEENANIASFSQAGQKHANQDSVFAGKLANDMYLLLIADGMGGHEGGIVASTLAKATVVDLLNSNPDMRIDEIFQKVRLQLISRAETDDKLSEMGTTLTLCTIKDDNAYVGHVGDSRLYLLRGDGLKTITKDQTEAQRLVDDGVLNTKEAKKYPRRNVLLSVMSPKVDYNLQLTRVPLQKKRQITASN